VKSHTYGSFESPGSGHHKQARPFFRLYNKVKVLVLLTAHTCFFVRRDLADHLRTVLSTAPHVKQPGEEVRIADINTVFSDVTQVCLVYTSWYIAHLPLCL
jgi:hypothetical protein